jgi:hypothetical protein
LRLEARLVSWKPALPLTTRPSLLVQRDAQRLIPTIEEIGF